ncbi:MAG: hypothetical protein HQL66_11040 [Magnetococcales bacterium]|nr:hypothetical protein [Magnetococcales bacterium]
MNTSPTANVRELVATIARLREMPIGGRYSELVLQRDRRVAENFLASFPGRAHSVLGIIATIRGDEEGMRHHFEAARVAEPREAYIRTNHLVALQGFACFSEAVLEAREACKEQPRHADLLVEAIFACIYAGRFQEAARWLENRDKLALPTPVSGAEEVVACARFLREMRVSDQEVESLQLQAASILRERGILGAVAQYSLRQEETDHWIALRFVLRQSAREVADLEWLLAERLARSALPERAFRHVVVGYLSREEPY